MSEQAQSTEKILPQGMQWINMNKHVKAVVKHLAFDRELQSQMGFFPCDENGIAINQPADATPVMAEIKKNPVVVEDEIKDYEVSPEIDKADSRLVNPLEEETELVAPENNAATLKTPADEPVKVELNEVKQPAKRGPKPRKQ